MCTPTRIMIAHEFTCFLNPPFLNLGDYGHAGLLMFALHSKMTHFGEEFD